MGGTAWLGFCVKGGGEGGGGLFTDALVGRLRVAGIRDSGSGSCAAVPRENRAVSKQRREHVRSL